jgi:myosin-9
MEDRPTTIRVYPGELRPVYYTSVLASQTTTTLEVIRLALERLQIFEDKTLYELHEGCPGDEDNWTLLKEGENPVVRQANWCSKDTRFYLKRKRNASLVLQQLVSELIPAGNGGVNAEITDLCILEELCEETMLSRLKARFSAKSIYTYAGTILIAVNPYYFYQIYNPKYTALYQGRLLDELPPHIFAIADRSYHSMLGDRQNQTVIISGESGAGKTESTKFLLHHLMSLSAKMAETQSLELITLGTGPVLEAFGNARTLANNNSSRFGKFIQVQFKENGAYYGASIVKYLLEKSRIISQAPGERNYHVFYYLLAGADSQLRRSLHLLKINEYHYLTQGSALAPAEGVEEYHRLRQSLSMLNFSHDIQLRMFTVLSAILHIGNLTFRKKEGEDSVVVENVATLSVISRLLQVREETLRLALTTRTSKAGGADLFVTPYKMEEAVAARDSLAKALYGSLFDWIVDQVNVSLASSSSRLHPHKGRFIGVLDIFGFEVFQNNSFEQFCINYANEQLQQYFNKHIFTLEQAEYSSEGIEWSAVSFIDNQECLDLIAKKPTGLLPLLDEECSFPGADDNSLFQKFERQHKSHPHYRVPQLRHQNPVFTIVHYASDVTYSVKGFRTKNRDLMRQDIIDVLRTSHSDLVRALIGLPPLAVHRWHLAFRTIVASFTFKKAGVVHKMKMMTPSFQHRLLRAATPPVPYSQTDGSSKFSQSYVHTHNLTDALTFDSTTRLAASSSSPGIRTSRYTF